ncbi:hypothetical protein N7507_010309 [Penicillium longicatenatum]|nr:hypothetical protein N7507_010309 [Penicillium longicatenatum]
MAEKYIAYFGSGYSAMELLRLTTEVFSELPEDEFWLPKFVTDTLQEMASRGKPKVNIRDSSTVSKAGSLAIMAAVIEAQSSHIMELESRITFQIRTGVTRRDHGPGYYPYLYNPYPRYPRPVSPSSAANSTSPRVPRYHRPASTSSAAYSASPRAPPYHRPASPSSAAYSASVGAHRYARSASPSSEGSDMVGESVITPDESSEDSAPTKDCFSVEVTEDRSHEKEGPGRPDSPVLKEPVTVFAYEESVVEAVEASVYEESIAENSVNEEAFTEERQPVDEESVEEIIYEEPTWDEPAAEEPAPEEPVPVEIVAEPIAPETNRPHSLLLNSDLYKDWKTLSPKKRRMRTKRLVRQGLPVPDKDGVISITLA